MKTVSHCNDEKFIYLNTPFRFQKGHQLKCSNAKTNCTYDEIQTFITKNMLTSLDWNILNTLYQYRILNKHLIVLAIGESSTDKIKKKLKKLTEQGLIIRYYLTNESGDSPNIYSLSKGMLSFLRKRYPLTLIFDNNNNSDLTNEENILKRLVINQFDIVIKQDYSNLISKSYFYHPMQYNNVAYTLQALYRLNYGDKSKNDTFALSVFVIRRNEAWKDDYIKVMYAYIANIKKHPLKFKNSIPLLICEDDLHIKETFLTKESNQITKNMYCLFTSDISLLTSSIFENLIQCDYEDNFVQCSELDLSDIPDSDDIYTNVQPPIEQLRFTIKQLLIN